MKYLFHSHYEMITGETDRLVEAYGFRRGAAPRNLLRTIDALANLRLAQREEEDMCTYIRDVSAFHTPLGVALVLLGACGDGLVTVADSRGRITEEALERVLEVRESWREWLTYTRAVRAKRA